MKQIIVLLMALGLSLSVYAQRGNRGLDPEKRAKKEIAELKKQLNLDEKQEKECYNLHLDHYKKQKEIFKNRSDRETMMKKMKERREKFHAGMKKILTKEQFTMYNNILKERTRKMKEARGGQSGRGRGGRGRGQGMGL